MPMSLPREDPLDDRLTGYLLGSLSEDETQHLDELTLVDDEMAARLRLVEDDLLDAYASGTLTGDRLERFEAFYLRSPLRREKAEFAKRLLATVDARPAAASAATPFARRWSLTLSLAAAALLFLASGILLLQGVRLRGDLREAERTVAASDAQNRALSAELQQQRTTTPASAVPSVGREAAPVTAIALVLLPQTRGVEAVPIVAVHAGTAMVPLQLRIDAAQAASYDAALRDPTTNGIVWRSAPLASLRGRRPPVVPVGVPARLLKSQHYVVDLFLVSGRAVGARELAGSYAFEVVRH